MTEQITDNAAIEPVDKPEPNTANHSGPPEQHTAADQPTPTVSADESIQIPVRDAEQIRRARVLLRLASTTDNADDRFVLLIGALHLARAVPEYWFTTAHEIPPELGKAGKDATELEANLRDQFQQIFSKVRRFGLITELRQWDYHWEPVINAQTIGRNMTYGRGAPMRLTTGPTPNSLVAIIGDPRNLITKGSGRRIGRKNYYRISQSRYVDFDKSEALPLQLAIEQFLDDLPKAIAEILQISEVQEAQTRASS